MSTFRKKQSEGTTILQDLPWIQAQLWIAGLLNNNFMRWDATNKKFVAHQRNKISIILPWIFHIFGLSFQLIRTVSLVLKTGWMDNILAVTMVNMFLLPTLYAAFTFWKGDEVASGFNTIVRKELVFQGYKLNNCGEE